MSTCGEYGVEMIFHRVNNTFISRLEIGFRQEHLHLLYYLRSNVDDFQCEIRALRVRGTEMVIDYAVVEFLGVYLKPHVYEMWIWAASVEEEYIMLFAHNALRGNLRHLVFEVSDSPANL
ncbi:hypothetical protein AAVH_16299 [Aphelenchoides avenae]|nr:hypothetical protein AAVH_16299 [Aphelenchus avenae]